MNHTTVIIIITVAVSLMAWQNKTFLGRLVFDPICITRHKQYDRFLTSGFVHGDGMHLLFNMITLYFFGRTMERFYIHELGALGFVGFYVLAIIASSIPDYIRHKTTHALPVLGHQAVYQPYCSPSFCLHHGRSFICSLYPFLPLFLPLVMSVIAFGQTDVAQDGLTTLLIYQERRLA